MYTVVTIPIKKGSAGMSDPVLSELCKDHKITFATAQFNRQDAVHYWTVYLKPKHTQPSAVKSEQEHRYRQYGA